MSSYVYLESERGLWTAGHYAPGGGWVAESDHDSEEKAAERVRYLNGGEVHELTEQDKRADAMTNHIQQIPDDLADTPETSNSATWSTLLIRSICALAQEVRHINNTMAWGAPEDIPARVPAEAGEVAREFDRELSEASELHDCTTDYPGCFGCPDLATCAHTDART